MKRRLIYIQIALWACIAVFGLGMLCYSIANEMTMSYKESSTLGYEGTLSESTSIGGEIVESYDIKEQDIEKIRVDLVSEDVTVSLGNSDSIQILHYANKKIPSREKLQVNTSSNTLSIHKKHKMRLFNFNMIKERVEIILPQNFSTKLDIETVSGDIYIEEGLYYNLDLSSVSGNQVVNHIKADILTQSTISGSIKNGSLSCERIEIETVSGGVDSYFQQIPRKLEVESISGNIDILLPENDGFEISYETVSGTVKSNFEIVWEKKEKMKGEGVYKEEVGNFEIETISGNISINK